MGGLVKILTPILIIVLGASYSGVLIDVVATARVSLQSIELGAIDDALQREAVMADDPRKDPYPETPADFEEFMQTAFKDRGDDNTEDQWGEPLLYAHPSRQVYTVASKGPDKQPGNEDDLRLERDGDKREMTHSMADIEDMADTEIGKEGQRQTDRKAQVEQALRSAGLPTDVDDLLAELAELAEQASSGEGEPAGADPGEEGGGKPGTPDPEAVLQALQGLMPGPD